MNFMFGNKNVKSVPPRVRVERVAVEQPKAPLPSKLALLSQQARSHSNRDRERHASLSARSSPSGSRASSARPSAKRHSSVDAAVQPQKRKAHQQIRASRQRLVESDDEDEGDTSASYDHPQKKSKAGPPLDPHRKFRDEEAFSTAEAQVVDMIHAADVTLVGKKPKDGAQAATEPYILELAYPSNSQRERYQLVLEKDQIDPVREIREIAEHVSEAYLTHEQRKQFQDPSSGIIRRIERAGNLLKNSKVRDVALLDGFKEAVEEYNMALNDLFRTGELGKNLDRLEYLNHSMVHCILAQVYDRAVSPKVDLLKVYQNGTDNIYGELLNKFVSKIIVETKLKSDQVFIDLGSGVGNVVLQTALEAGCESWGCEIMENACKLAEAQEKEFAARCRLWGVRAGKVKLERGDFMKNDNILAAMKRADVILVNNEKFTAALNMDLIHLFLELKDGCRIVSLQSFVPHDHNQSRNFNNPVNMLRVEKQRYYSNSVSWTDAAGDYYIATKDSRRMREASSSE